MNPRLKTSKKWTAFPKEYLGQIQQAFGDTFKAQLGDAKLVIEGRIYPEEILLRVGILEKGRLRQSNFEASLQFSTKSSDAVLENIHNCIDAVASMMQEYFEAKTGNDEEDEVDFPMSWKEYEFNKKSIYLQYSTVNTDLEAQANALLGEAGDEALINEEEPEDDTEDEEAFESEGPSMMGGPRKKKKDDLH